MAFNGSPILGPNLLITGTPGTGKSTLSAQVAERCGLVHVDVSQFAIEHQLVEGWDEQLATNILDEDGVLDALEPDMSGPKGRVVDYHSSELFPERWFDIVFVLRTDNSVLHPRLVARGYSNEKVTANVECEIFQVCLDEAMASYQKELVYELKSNTVEEMEANLEQIVEWVKSWQADNM